MCLVLTRKEHLPIDIRASFDRDRRLLAIYAERTQQARTPSTTQLEQLRASFAWGRRAMTGSNRKWKPDKV